MRKVRSLRAVASVAAVAIGACFASATLRAQLDPLAFLKRIPPTVILVTDTGIRMLNDGNGNYYDPQTYNTGDDLAVSTVLGVLGTTTYRRVFNTFTYESNQDASTKFEATSITAVADTAAGYATFWDTTRLEIMKKGISKAVGENASSQYRWGMVKLRQSNPAWRVSPNCDKPVRITADAAQQLQRDSSPCSAGNVGRYGVYMPTVSAPNYSLETTGDAVVAAAGPNTASTIVTKVDRALLDAQGLIPAGQGTRNYQDRPLTHALDDARAQAVTAMVADADRDCRNTIVVLLTGGKDDGDNSYLGSHSVTATAATFLSVTGGGVTRRVPIYVVGIKPGAADVTELQNIASGSGGRYFGVTDADGVARVINQAVQAGFSRQPDFATSAASEYQPVSPIVGTVNLTNASSASNSVLPNTAITAGGVPIPQRSNVLLTSGFSLPDFEGKLRAFRTFVPVADPSKPSGYKFVKDGTPLWRDRDGRPETAGLARVEKLATDRNIYTRVPVAGTWQTVSFTSANVADIKGHLGIGASPTDAAATAVIEFVRSLPLGAVIGSTPAMMDPPSLDPPPDNDYGRSGAAGSFADTYKDRRAIIFVGGNDGMIHAIDARTGFEVWAFIPYNLLPKLRTLVDGQPVDQFDYFVDSSPKIAEVKIMKGGTRQWRTLLVIGQGPGGTFYQALDVTEAGMGGPVPESDDYAAVRQSFLAPANTNRIEFLWAFPEYARFDTTYYASKDVADGTSGGKVRFYGELAPAATAAEESVGFTWSDPAVGTLAQDRSVNAVIAGSGYFPSVTGLPGRADGSPAGGAFYLLNAETGALLGNEGGIACANAASGSGCIDVGDAAGSTPKNALQADPTAAADYGSYVAKKAYLGDLDGKYWRFDFQSNGTITRTQMVDTAQPIYNSSALLLVGSVNTYMFFSTGSDLLPTTAIGGTGTFKLYGLKDNAPAAGATTVFTRNLAAVTNVSGQATGERASTSPSVAGDIVFYTATTQDAAAACTDFSSKLYAFTYLGGAAYDTNASGSITSGESPVIKTVAGRATAPFIVDQHLYFGTAGAAGSNVEIFGDPEDFNNGVGQVGVRILSWREVR